MPAAPLRRLLLLTVAVVASGCATAVRGTTDSVSIAADQDSALVFVDGVAAGTAPLSLDVARSQGHRVEVVREGFRVGRAEITRDLNVAVVAGSVLLGGLASLAVDLSSGAAYDLDPHVYVALVPDSTGAHVERVAEMTRQARAAPPDNYARATVYRRRPGPWPTVQLSSGIYTGNSLGEDRDASSVVGGIGSGIAVGVRSGPYTARLSGTAGAGFLFDNSELWEVAALAGVVVESDTGRFRSGTSVGPAVSGGRESNACFLCDRRPGLREALPTRVGVTTLTEVYVFVTPQIGIGLQAPLSIDADRVTHGVLLGLKFEGL